MTKESTYRLGFQTRLTELMSKQAGITKQALTPNMKSVLLAARGAGMPAEMALERAAQSSVPRAAARTVSRAVPRNAPLRFNPNANEALNPGLSAQVQDAMQSRYNAHPAMAPIPAEVPGLVGPRSYSNGTFSDRYSPATSTPIPAEFGSPTAHQGMPYQPAHADANGKYVVSPNPQQGMLNAHVDQLYANGDYHYPMSNVEKLQGTGLAAQHPAYGPGTFGDRYSPATSTPMPAEFRGAPVPTEVPGLVRPPSAEPEAFGFPSGSGDRFSPATPTDFTNLPGYQGAPPIGFFARQGDRAGRVAGRAAGQAVDWIGNRAQGMLPNNAVGRFYGQGLSPREIGTRVLTRGVAPLAGAGFAGNAASVYGNNAHEQWQNEHPIMSWMNRTFMGAPTYHNRSYFLPSFMQQ